MVYLLYFSQFTIRFKWVYVFMTSHTLMDVAGGHYTEGIMLIGRFFNVFGGEGSFGVSTQKGIGVTEEKGSYRPLTRNLSD